MSAPGQISSMTMAVVDDDGEDSTQKEEKTGRLCVERRRKKQWGSS
jgi:hypothetical protein